MFRFLLIDICVMTTASQRRVETENEEEDDNVDDEGAQPADMLDQVRAVCIHRHGHVLTGTPKYRASH